MDVRIMELVHFPGTNESVDESKWIKAGKC